MITISITEVREQFLKRLSPEAKTLVFRIINHKSAQ